VLSEESFEQLQCINHLTARQYEAEDRIRAVRLMRRDCMIDTISTT